MPLHGELSLLEQELLYNIWKKTRTCKDDVIIDRPVRDFFCKEFKKSYSAISNSISLLKKKGYIQNKSRSRYVLNEDIFFPITDNTIQFNINVIIE